MQTSGRTLTADEARNKAIVLEYYHLLTQDWNFDAARPFLGGRFVQHNPTIPDGIDGLKSWIDNRPPFTDALKADIRRVLVDGNFVMLHTIVSAPAVPDMPPMCIADLFRLEDGKVVEHWDVIQPVPPEAQHANGIA